MLMCPVIMVFYVKLFGNYNLKMSKINQLFITYAEVGGHIVMGIPLNTCTCRGAILLSITSIIH